MRDAYKIVIENDESVEVWGPYKCRELASEVMAAYVGVPESATIKAAKQNDIYSARPE